MRNFLRIAKDVVVGPINQLLWMHPDMWNQHGFRREFEATPHSGVDDIWLRYMPEDADMLNPEEAQSVWYPEAQVLSGVVRPLVLDLMRATNAYMLERLLITRLPPGGRILPHSDKGAAYTSLAGIGRYHVVLQGLPGSSFRCGDEEVQMLTGDIWWFNAHLEHEVVNNSAGDRIHLLVDTRTWL